uniref:Uncharacterized protein n=1 Tax=Salvator merianae TaxID=96440 RepID=A0A8D0CG96_SALMN
MQHDIILNSGDPTLLFLLNLAFKSYSWLFTLPYKSLFCLVNHTPKYLTFFSISNPDLLPSSSCSFCLIFFTNILVFFSLIFKPAAFPYVSIRSFTVSINSFGSFKMITILSANVLSLYSSFLIFKPSILVSCLITLFITSNANINKSCESGHPCLVPFCIGNSCETSPLIISWYFPTL